MQDKCPHTQYDDERIRFPRLFEARNDKTRDHEKLMSDVKYFFHLDRFWHRHKIHRMADFEHILLTRFNVRPEQSKTEIITEKNWLTKRFELFERFCYPSIAAQTQKNFSWYVFFDVLTPDEFKHRISGYAKWENFIPFYVESISSDVAIETIRSHSSKYQTTHIITTRIDNDDALRSDFIEIVQKQFTGQTLEFLNFSHGLIWHRGKVYSDSQFSNPFISLIEKRDTMKTVWVTQHNRVSEIGHVRQIETPPAWLQVVHDTNISNELSGWRCHNTELADFRITAKPTDEGILDFLFDRYGRCLIRNLFEKVNRWRDKLKRLLRR